MRSGVVLLLLAFGLAGVGEAATLEWVDRIYADGEHNAFTDLVNWRGQYYVCFRHATSHSSFDGEIRVMRSADMRTWTPCGTVDTAGDDRDPHFAAATDKLYLFFGTWDIVHMEDEAPPDRRSVRSYMSYTEQGDQWSKPKGTYDAGWWLWSVSYHDGTFYSAAYSAVRPKPTTRETRLLQSPDGVQWTLLSTVTRERSAGEAALRFNSDGSAWLISRTNDEPGGAIFARSNPDKTSWTIKDLGTLVHSPSIAQWKERFFIAGRGKADEGYVTRIWEIIDLDGAPQLKEVVTLPSGGDTAYPGLVADPASLDGEDPKLFVTWYSQHEKEQLGDGNNIACIYAAKVSVK